MFSHPLIVGCWQLDERSWKPISESEIAQAIETYLSMGINVFDTADIYGRSEKILGKILKGKESKIFTKAVFFGGIPTPNEIRTKVENSLRNLQKDRLDLLQIHWQHPQFDFASTFEVLNQLVEEGKIAELGVTNFNTPMLELALQYSNIKTNQVQYSLIDRRVENLMQAFCSQRDIKLLTYGSLSGGFLSDKFRQVASPKLERQHARSFYYISMIINSGGWQNVLEMLETLAEIGEKYQMTISQVALNWIINQPAVGAILSGFTTDVSQIESNIAAFTKKIDPADLQVLSEKSASLFTQTGDIYSYERAS